MPTSGVCLNYLRWQLSTQLDALKSKVGKTIAIAADLKTLEFVLGSLPGAAFSLNTVHQGLPTDFGSIIIQVREFIHRNAPDNDFKIRITFSSQLGTDLMVHDVNRTINQEWARTNLPFPFWIRELNPKEQQIVALYVPNLFNN